ncbi:unnamed protein product [Bursaphelenchus okinawaensis]|uniref:Uncharacterized protein n=1 Tax=Bursaphelenchus okinawaensis TaxID=465554 RepID=A0A811JTY7_9BILA|nr:unnamed protein product [Bursaphelenchus okinawaensis]CAG9082827.1 unnamed protein product [Bursaphelenchus okinawaensis]
MDYDAAYLQIHGKTLAEEPTEEKEIHNTKSKTNHCVSLKPSSSFKLINIDLNYQSPKKVPRPSTSDVVNAIGESPCRSSRNKITDSVKKRLNVFLEPNTPEFWKRDLTKDEDVETEEVEIETSEFVLKKQGGTRKRHENKENFVKINMKCKKYISKKKTNNKKLFKRKFSRV